MTGKRKVIRVRLNELLNIMREVLTPLVLETDRKGFSAEMSVIVHDVDDDLQTLWGNLPEDVLPRFPKLKLLKAKWPVHASVLANMRYAGDIDMEREQVDEIKTSFAAAVKEASAGDDDASQSVLETLQSIEPKAVDLVKRYIEKTRNQSASGDGAPKSAGTVSSSDRSVYEKIMRLNSKSDEFASLKETMINVMDDINTLGLSGDIQADASSMYMQAYKVLQIFQKLYEGQECEPSMIQQNYDSLKKKMQELFTASVGVMKSENPGSVTKDKVVALKDSLELAHGQLSSQKAKWLEAMNDKIARHVAVTDHNFNRAAAENAKTAVDPNAQLASTNR